MTGSTSAGRLVPPVAAHAEPRSRGPGAPTGEIVARRERHGGYGSCLVALGLIAFMVWQGLDDGSASDPGANGSAAAPTAEGEAAAGPAGAGSVAVGDVDLLSLAEDPDALAGYEGREARASSAVVESVVSDEGFWVGEAAGQRLFVFLDLEVESGPDVDPGDEVDFTGTLEPPPFDFADRFAVTPGEGSGDLEEQGRYLSVTQIASS